MRWHLIHDVISYDVICDICYRRRKRWSTWCDTSVWRYIHAVMYMTYIVWCRWRRQKNTRTTSFGRATLSAPSSTTRSCLGQPRKKGRHGSWRSTCPATRISRKRTRVKAFLAQILRWVHHPQLLSSSWDDDSALQCVHSRYCWRHDADRAPTQRVGESQ